MRGHGGNFSFLTPRMQTTQHRWQCSAHLTALHSLAAVALANTLMTCPGYDDVRNVCSSLVTHFSVVLPERLPLFCAPSLSLLARHYVDSAEEVQQAARALMEGTLLRTNADVRQQIVAAWSPRVLRVGVPNGASAADLTSPQGVSLLVLAVLSSRFGTPIEPRVCNILAHQLVRLLGHNLEAHRAWAAEIIGKGYHLWRPHLAEAPADEATSRAARSPADAPAAGGAMAASAADVIRALFRLSVARDAESQITRQLAGEAKGQRPAGGVGRASQNSFQVALMAVAVAEPRHFCTCMGDHAVHVSAGSATRIAAVSALVMLVRSRGLSLERDLPMVTTAALQPFPLPLPLLLPRPCQHVVCAPPASKLIRESWRSLSHGIDAAAALVLGLVSSGAWQVVEAVMRPLDPSVPSMREASLTASTSALRELVKRYPMMAFHQVRGRAKRTLGVSRLLTAMHDCLAPPALSRLVRSALPGDATVSGWYRRGRRARVRPTHRHKMADLAGP